MTNDEIGTIADLEAIRDLAVRYAHGVWTKDVVSIAALFVEDGEMDTGREVLRGRDAIRSTYARVFAQDDFFPFVHNHVIDIAGADASGTSYLDLRAVIGGARMTGFGSYSDRYARTPDGWKFRARRLVMEELRPAPD